MNRGRGDNRRAGRNRGGGGGGGRHYAARGQSAQPPKKWVDQGVVGDGTHMVDASSGAGSSDIGRKFSEKATVDGGGRHYAAMGQSAQPPKKWVDQGVVGDGTHMVDASSGAGSSNIGRKFSEKATVDGGGRHYAARGQSAQPPKKWVDQGVVGDGAHMVDASSGAGSSDIGRKFSENKLLYMLSTEYPSEPNSESHGSSLVSPNDENFKGVQSVQNVPETGAKPLNVTHTGPIYDNHIPSLLTNSELNESSMVIQPRNRDVESCSPSHIITTFPQTVSCQFSPEVQSGKNKLDSSDSQHDGVPFDICVERSSKVPKLKPALRIRNKPRRNGNRRVQGDNIDIIRPGMILLKGYIALPDQVKLVKACRDLGKGPGGFYQPGFRDGAKLHLKMMCLGKNWDPETSQYGDKRPIDQAEPPPVPDEFKHLVEKAIQECHDHLASEHKVKNPKFILPLMSPDICIINFYSKTGNLGLHQDKDESPKSLLEGLPVVSISLGDTAEFLFGDERDVNKADKVALESGDVLIFGGKSRHIFHGVGKILADTAPSPLLEETDLKPGHLNLTFRKE